MTAQPTVDADGVRIWLTPTRPRLPAARCLTDIWPHLTPRKRLAWLPVVEREAAGVAAASARARARLWRPTRRERQAMILQVVFTTWEDGVRHPGPFDEVLEDPTFWQALALQCREYGPAAPERWQPILARLGEAAEDLLEAIEREGTRQ